MSIWEKILTGALQLLFAGAILVIGYFVLMHVMSPSAPDAPSPQKVQQPVKPQPTPNIYPEEDHTSNYSPTDGTPTVTPATSETGDVIQYDSAKKARDEARDQTMVNASMCSQKRVRDELGIGVRSRKEITEFALMVCGQEMAMRSQLYKLGLTNEMIKDIITANVNNEIENTTR
jgi:hypothetical protein